MLKPLQTPNYFKEWVGVKSFIDSEWMCEKCEVHSLNLTVRTCQILPSQKETIVFQPSQFSWANFHQPPNELYRNKLFFLSLTAHQNVSHDSAYDLNDLFQPPSCRELLTALNLHSSHLKSFARAPKKWIRTLPIESFFRGFCCLLFTGVPQLAIWWKSGE